MVSDVIIHTHTIYASRYFDQISYTASAADMSYTTNNHFTLLNMLAYLLTANENMSVHLTTTVPLSV